MRRAPKPPERAVAGLDISLRRSAAVFLPEGWKPGTWDGVQWCVAPGREVNERDPEAAAERIVEVVDRLLLFLHGECDWLWHVPNLFVEGYAFNIGKGSRAIDTAEIAGTLKYMMRKSGNGPVIRAIASTSARKIFLGDSMPAKGAADAALSAVQRLSPPWGEGSDEGDALIVANAGRHLLGLPVMTLG